MANYPYDPSGKASTNYVTGSYVRSKDIDKSWMIIPNGGVFYTANLIVVNNVDNKELRPNVQYRALELNQEVTNDTGLEACTIILILDDGINDVTIKNQIVGGRYAVVGSDIDKIVTDSDMAKLATSSWSQVIGAPQSLPPDEHAHYEEDITGLSEMVYALDAIKSSVQTGDAGAFKMIYDYIDRSIDAMRNEHNTQLKTMASTIAGVQSKLSPQNSMIIIMTTNDNPRDLYGWGTWRRLDNTLLRSVANDADLGGSKKIGEGPDYPAYGVYFWQLVKG